MKKATASSKHCFHCQKRKGLVVVTVGFTTEGNAAKKIEVCFCRRCAGAL